jgi:hypothetical protein
VKGVRPLGSQVAATFGYVDRSTVTLHSLGRFIERPSRLGNDGLTDAERASDLARFTNSVGKAPVSTPERTERIKRLTDTVEPQQWRRRFSD